MSHPVRSAQRHRSPGRIRPKRQPAMDTLPRGRRVPSSTPLVDSRRVRCLHRPRTSRRSRRDRIFFFPPGRRIVLLTVFRKQRMNDGPEINRARAAMARCVAHGHTAEKDDR